MAYKPSLRRAMEPVAADLDIRPVMNLMVVLIPLLLAGAEFVKLSVIEVNLPPKTSGGSAGKNKKDNPEEKEKEKKIQLSITLTSKGIYVASASGVLSGDETASEDAASPTVPLTPDGKNDLKALKEKLIEIKTKIKGQNFKDDNTITITAESEVFLQDVIDIMDIVMIYEDTDGEAKELFPKVQFGKVI